MTQHAEPHAGSSESLRRAIIHLRLRFSVVLTPLFIWGVYLALPRALPWSHIALAYLIIHIPLYGGMNAFNSFYDRDDGPIGALLEPPPVNYTVFAVAMICKALALLAGLLLDIRFGLLVGTGIALSVLYSHPWFRWKERPTLAAICIFVGQGVLGVLWGWTAAMWQPGLAATPIWPPGGLGALATLSAACWTLGFYPLTGAYQIEGDRRNNVRTLAVALGVTGSFVFAALVATLGGLGVWLLLFARGAYLGVALSGVYVVGAAVYTLRWYRQFDALTVRQNQQVLMRLANTNGIAFTVLFLALVLWGT